MKIGLIGYGKMGKEIEKIAPQRGHEIVWKMNADNRNGFSPADLATAEVVIEFTSPHAALGNIQMCFDAGVPVVVGSTGWYDHLPQVKNDCEHGGHSMIYASNFSVGVNIFFALNKKLASIMNSFPGYDVSLTEVHHTQKLDAPSGTAITLAKDILENLDRKSSWISGEPSANEELSVISVREDEVPGTHKVVYDSAVDSIEIVHTAHNRQGFALGAVLAAEWIRDKKGFYEIGEMFQFG